jgi:phenylacetate-CoA ligase
MSLSSFLTRNVGLRVIDIARKTKTVSVLNELKKTEFSSREVLSELQLYRLKALLLHCRDRVPYYRHLFDDVGLEPEAIERVDDIQRLPILTKDDIRTHFSDLKASDFETFRPRIKETGGSTGQPLRLYHDELSHSTMWGNIYRGFGFAGYSLGDKYLTIASGSLLPKKLKFGRNFYFFFQNSLIVPSYHIEQDYVAEIVSLIRRKRPKFVYGYSSSLVSLARIIQSSGIVIEGIQAVFTTADMLYPDQRELIEEALSTKVFDNYGCPEAGVMTFECSEHDGYHYNMESAYVEVVDPDASGAGRLISTNLTNFAFPIVRYDTGDIGRIERGGLCRCGRSHDKVSALLGRQRDILTLSSGRMIHGAFFNHFPGFYNYRIIERYQIIQTQLDHLEVHVQLQAGYTIDDILSLAHEIEIALDGMVTVTLIQNEFRESSLSKKHRTVISDVQNIWTGGASSL